MATPVFQHGKNAFLGLGYEVAATATTGSVSSGTLTTGTVSLTSLLGGGNPTLDSGAIYGAFVNGIPCATATKFANGTTSYALAAYPTGMTAAAGSSVLPLINLSKFINDISFPQQIETPETTTFSAEGVKTYIVGLKGYTISFGGHYEATAASTSSGAYTPGGADAIMSALISWQDAGNFIPFVYGPATPGKFTVSGAAAVPFFYGQGLLTKYDLKSGVNNIVEFDGELQISGAVTRAVF